MDAESDGPLWLEIYDVRGLLVMKSMTVCPARLDIAQLTPGIYFLRATYSDGRHEVVEFVKGK